MIDGGAFVLRRELHFCLVDGSYVFLDLETQRYFLLPTKAAAAFRHFLDCAMTNEDSEWLLRNRLIQRAGQSSPRYVGPVVVAEVRAAIDGPLPRADLIPTLRIISAQVLARRWLRREPLGAIFNYLRDQQRPVAPAQVDRSAPDLVRAIAAFRASERIWNAVDQCLPRGIVLYTLLRRLGFAPTLVIGVCLPFAAHCWVQIDDCVISDDLDRVRSFTPIFAL